jgi:hypothetical protein
MQTLSTARPKLGLFLFLADVEITGQTALCLQMDSTLFSVRNARSGLTFPVSVSEELLSFLHAHTFFVMRVSANSLRYLVHQKGLAGKI